MMGRTTKNVMSYKVKLLCNANPDRFDLMDHEEFKPF